MSYNLKLLQIKALISASKISLIGLFGVVNTICVVLYPTYKSDTLLLWCIGMNISILSRAILVKQSLHINSSNYKIFYTLYIILLALSSTLYSSILLLFFPDNSIEQLFLIIMLTGIISSGVIQNAYTKLTLHIYLISSLLPLFIFFTFYKKELSIVSIILFLYYILSLRIGYNIYLRYTTMIKLKNRYKDLISHYNLEKQKIDYFYNYIPIGIFIYDKNLKVISVNDYLAKNIIGVSKDRLEGLNLNTLRDKSLLHPLKSALEEGYAEYEGYYHTTLTNKILYLKLIASKLNLKDRVEAIAVLIDMTDDINNREKVEYLAYYDGLTNIYKRDVLIDELNSILNAFKESKDEYYSAMIYFDIDKFKDINDHLGHNIGDQILKILTDRIKKIIDSRYIFARMGGDEFAILMPLITKDIDTIYQKIKELSKSIYQISKEDINIGSNTFNISLSIGAVIIDKNFKEAYDIIKAADASMYRAKRDKNIFMYIYDEELDRYIKSRYKLKDEITLALKRGEFKVYLQPITDKYYNITSAEVLARWHHPTKGVVTPDYFLDTMLEYNMIEEFSRYIIKLVSQISYKLPQYFTLSINITAEDIKNRDFIDFICNLDFNCKIDLELTEQIVIDNIEQCFENMKYLNKRGFSFSLDDFGTGYSSLSYLNKLPIKYLKIDKSFIDDMLTDKSDLAIVETIITMAHILEFKTISEGIENKEQFDKLKSMGCDYFQGYYLYKPQSIDDIIKLLP